MKNGKKEVIQIGNVFQTKFDNPTRGRVYSVCGLAPTINTCAGGYAQPIILEWCWDENNEKRFRIRKLTPRECFRLMDVRDDDFEKLLATDSFDKNGNPKRAISDSQLYKMAGNSIVVSCMDLIFENLFFPTVSEDSLF